MVRTSMIDSSPIIRMFHVYKRYGKKHALVDISLDIAKNEFVFINGHSGAGKSTLMKLLYRAEEASEGQILVDGINLNRIPRKKIPFLRRKFGIIFQDYQLLPEKSIHENVALVLEAAGQTNIRAVRKKVSSLLSIVGMEDRRDAYPQFLSGGEQQRVAVARAVAGNPRIIIADEPTAGLDSESAGTIMDLLKRFHMRGATVIIATHDKKLIDQTGGRMIQLKNGRIEHITIAKAIHDDTVC